MSTVVEITDLELAELQSLTRQTDPSSAIRSAMAEYIRFAKRQQLKALSGQVQMDDNWRAQEAAELRSENGNDRPRAR